MLNIFICSFSAGSDFLVFTGTHGQLGSPSCLDSEGNIVVPLYFWKAVISADGTERYGFLGASVAATATKPNNSSGKSSNSINSGRSNTAAAAESASL